MRFTAVADFVGIAAIGLRLVRQLNLSFGQRSPLDDGSRVKAVLLRTEEMDPNGSLSKVVPPMVSLFLYRVDVNRHTRAAWSAVANQNNQIHLPLDLHFILTPWASNAEFEYRILAQAMSCLEQTPILSGPLLYPTANWSGNESVQLCIPEMSTEDLMRTFDSLPINYKLSIPYLASVVRIDANTSVQAPRIHHAEFGTKPGVSP